MLKPNTMIPAVRGFKELEKALASPHEVIFLLEGELIQLQNIVGAVKQANKKIYLHLEMVKGIKDDEASIHFLSKVIKIDGIISTRTSCLLHAKKYGLSAIQRGFIIDSHSIRTIINSAAQVKPDYIEILPSFSYPKLNLIKNETGLDIILGGFVEKKEELPVLFNAGAIAVSTSRIELWS
ncbi:glycerol-3-phosphate responsive antiterminator [Paenibacillus tyrfis]|uniref:Glycerol uptake operon antiterminator regulatory protein n=1 Tax=Paenibacillus tyrfis TaxID=1501230 RepID=A0A081NZG8_9BACL|nr:glycerol-3-phosphate responsive antiterminator [Paenibacillus tyrfis]KEQ23841.1 transcriptional regulator [Paenibacillus tyrfis]